MAKPVLKKRHRNQLLETKLNAAPASIKTFNDFVSDERYKAHPIYFVFICISTKDLAVAKVAFEHILKTFKPHLNMVQTMKLVAEKSIFEEIAKMAKEQTEGVVV